MTNTRRGLLLFTIYLVLYAGFLILNAFFPEAMDTLVLPDINLAVVYGLGLIVAAFVLALVYAWLCGRSPS
jgi:uncharacterized membrane protein (DUF485 family)